MNNKDSRERNPLDALIRAADATTLGELIKRLALSHPDVRRECFEFLKKHVDVKLETQADAEAGAIFALWEELKPDLSELDEYGGGDYKTEDYVADLLCDLAEELNQFMISREDRRALLDEVMPYIRSGNAGMDDDLYGVAHATCKDDEDWRDFAERLEESGKEWHRDQARRIYRRIGDRDKFLSLRSQRMEYGADYHDLATFYWEAGEREQALEVAREGLKKGQGRMDELLAFMSERAKEDGDRQGYLELQFAQAVSCVTLACYKTFEELCNEKEWGEYESRMLAAVEGAWEIEQLKIHIYREELDRAIEFFWFFAGSCG